jgi:hypothetical protein
MLKFQWGVLKVRNVSNIECLEREDHSVALSLRGNFELRLLSNAKRIQTLGALGGIAHCEMDMVL